MIKRRILIAWINDLPDDIKQRDLPRLALDKCPAVNIFETSGSTESECDAVLFRSLFDEGWTAYDSISCEERWNDVTRQWE